MIDVPGTVKASLPRLVRHRSGNVDKELVRRGSPYAAIYSLGECSVIVSRDPFESGYRWHLSIAHTGRYPTWDEQKTARYLAPELKTVTMASILGPVVDGEWVNVHENAFHWWEIET